tara:strand:+ start:4443 stop:4649 length:207 start_codon:yes stop_codon:yes gene_type:complete
MKLDLTNRQLSNLQFALCLAIHKTETDKKMNKKVQERLLQNYVETYDELNKQYKWQKINYSWKKVLDL